MKASTLFLSVLCSLEAMTMNAQKLMQTQTWFGDSMGFTSEDTATKKMEYFYDSNNKLIRKVQTGLLEDEESWILTNYGLYHYNDKGQLEQTNSLQYGLYDGRDYAFSESNDTVLYAYNEKGELIKDSTIASKTYNLYAYDEAGNLVRKEIFKKGKLSQTLEFSDFTVGGPQTVVATASASYNAYNGKMTYDAQGHKTSELHWTTDSVLNYAEYWTYSEAGDLVLYEKKGISGGKETDATKVEYEMLEDGSSRAKTYNYNGGSWYFKGGSTCLTTYGEFDAKYSVTALSADVNADKSEVALTFNAPEGIEGSVSFNIYRNGMLVGTVDSTSFLDTNVKNGDTDYFVQTVVEGVKKNTSDVVQVKMNRAYPRVTGLRATTARRSTEGAFIVTLAWNNPKITEAMGFVYNNIMKVGTYYTSPLLEDSTEITDPTQNTCDVSFGIDAVKTVFVQTKYACGSTTSDTITVNADEILGKVDEVNRKLRVVETYGDAMGEDLGITKKAVTFYGNDNRVQRTAVYSKAIGMDASDPANWTPVEYTVNVYGESGMMEKQYSQSYGRFDYGNMGYREATDTIYYEFNVDGLLTKESNNDGFTEYEYGADGSLVKKTITLYGTTDLVQTITYSNFFSQDKPMRTESTGDQNSYKWTLDTEYNRNGLKVSERKCTWSSYYNEFRPSQYEEFEYDANGELLGDTVFSITIKNDVEQYAYKSVTAYEPEEDNPNRVKVVKKVWDNILKKFSNPKTWNVYEYTEIDSKKYSPTLTLETPDGIGGNEARLTVDVPEDQKSAMTAFNIYRKGIEIAHCVEYYDDRYYQTDEYGLNGKFVFTDSKVRNGEYDYFVELVKLDASLTKAAQVNNISNIEWVGFDMDLPKVTGLKEVSRRQTSAANSDTGEVEVSTFVTLGWEAPEGKEEYGFQRYNVMCVGSQIGENIEEETFTATTYELAMRGRDSLLVYIQSVYDFGYSFSDTIVVTEETIETGVQQVESSASASMDEKQLYNLMGQPVGADYKGIIVTRKKKYIVR